MQLIHGGVIEHPFRSSARKFWQEYRFPIGIALGLRIALSLWLAILWLILDPYLPLSGATLEGTYHQLTPQPTRLGRALLDVWLRWDAVHYMDIAREGYAGVSPADTNYLPLYPYLVYYVKPLTAGQELPAGLLVSTIACILAMIAFYRLVLDIFQDQALARWTVVAWGLFPTSFFLVAPFTEALFSALAIGSLLFLYRRKWLLSGLLAALAGLTRQQGVLLVFPMLAYALMEWRKDRAGLRLPAWFGIALAPAGYLAFTVWRSLQGLPFIMDSFLEHSRIIFMDPIRGYLSAVGFAIVTRDPLAITEAISVTLFIAITAWMFFQPRFMAHAPLLVYNLANLALFVSKHTLTASPIQSANRYVLSLYPAFIAIAGLLLRLPAQVQKAYILICLIVMLVLSTLYALWFFVG